MSACRYSPEKYRSMASKMLYVALPGLIRSPALLRPSRPVRPVGPLPTSSGSCRRWVCPWHRSRLAPRRHRCPHLRGQRLTVPTPARIAQTPRAQGHALSLAPRCVRVRPSCAWRLPAVHCPCTCAWCAATHIEGSLRVLAKHVAHEQVCKGAEVFLCAETCRDAAGSAALAGATHEPLEHSALRHWHGSVRNELPAVHQTPDRTFALLLDHLRHCKGCIPLTMNVPSVQRIIFAQMQG